MAGYVAQFSIRARGVARSLFDVGLVKSDGSVMLLLKPSPFHMANPLVIHNTSRQKHQKYTIHTYVESKASVKNHNLIKMNLEFHDKKADVKYHYTRAMLNSKIVPIVFVLSKSLTSDRYNLKTHLNNEFCLGDYDPENELLIYSIAVSEKDREPDFSNLSADIYSGSYVFSEFRLILLWSFVVGVKTESTGELKHIALFDTEGHPKTPGVDKIEEIKNGLDEHMLQSMFIEMRRSLIFSHQYRWGKPVFSFHWPRFRYNI